VSWILFVFFNVLWLYPVYALSLILNQGWYQEIADVAYEHLKIRSRNRLGYKVGEKSVCCVSVLCY
jgi:hypothetical protein